MCALMYVHDVIETSFGLSLKETLSDASSPARIGTITRLAPEDYTRYSPKELGEDTSIGERDIYIRKGSVPDIFEMAVTHFNRAFIENAAKQAPNDISEVEAVDIDVSGYRLRRKHTDVDYRHAWVSDVKASYPIPPQPEPPEATEPETPEPQAAPDPAPVEKEISLRWPTEETEIPPPRSFEEFLARM